MLLGTAVQPPGAEDELHLVAILQPHGQYPDEDDDIAFSSPFLAVCIDGLLTLPNAHVF